MKTSTHIIELMDLSSDLNLLIDKRTPRIIFKIKKYYVIYIWNGKSIDFNISETAAKNTLIYETFSKED